MKCSAIDEEMANSVDSSVENDDDDDRMHPRYYPLGTRGRYLFEERMRHLREEQRNQLQEEMHRRECTFHPKVLGVDGMKLNTSLDLKGSEEGDVLDPPVDSAISVFERLARQAEELRVKSLRRERERMLEEKADLVCSFRPQINTSRMFKRNTHDRHGRHVPVEERLLSYGRTVERQRASQRRQQEERERGEGRRNSNSGVHGSTSFVIDHEYRKAARQEFEERNQRLLQRRWELKSSAVEPAASSFQPLILPTSAALDEAARARLRAREAGNPHENDDGLRLVRRGELLYKKAMKSHVEKVQLAEKLRRRQENEICHGHKPNINPYTEDWIRHSAHQKLFAKDFVSRQQVYREAAEELRDLLAWKEEMEKKQKQAFSHLRVGSDGIQSQVERLYHNGIKALNVKSPTAQDSPLKECSFRPRLSKGSFRILQRMQNREKDFVSRLTGSRPSVGMDTRSCSMCSANDNLHDQKQEKEEDVSSSELPNSFESSMHENGSRRSHQSTSSRPEMDACSLQASSSKNRCIFSEKFNAFFQRQEEALRQRQERIRLEKERKEAEEMAVCTFHPKTNSNRLCTKERYQEKREVSVGASSSSSRFAKKGERGCDLVNKISGVQFFLMRQEEARRRRAEKAERLANLSLGKPLGRDKYGQKGACRVTKVAPFRLNTECRGNWQRSSLSQGTTLMMTEEDFDGYVSQTTVLASSESFATPRSQRFPPPRRSSK